jgi:amino acid transporter
VAVSNAAGERSIGIGGALSLGIGAIVGGGFFATFGLAIVGARGATYLSFLVGGALALLTCYSYIRLTLTYPGPGGTVAFVRRALGTGIVASAINVLLIFSYVAIMAVYARALAAYAAQYFPPGSREIAGRALASGSIILMGAVNFAGTALMARSEALFNAGKLGVLVVFIVGGFLLGPLEWTRLGMSEWVPAPTIITNGMVVFLAYEGFELIANASDRIRNPARTLPIAFYGSVLFAIAIYGLTIVVAIGHMPFAAMEAASDFALSAAAERFMGSFGFGLMTFGATLASASAINADFFGAEKLPVSLAEHGQMRTVFEHTIGGRAIPSMVLIGVLALLAVNLVDLQALSAATSGGFLIVYAAVNVANARLAGQTGSRAWISALAAAACIAALGTMVFQFAADPATRSSAYAVVVILLAALGWEIVFRLSGGRRPEVLPVVRVPPRPR